MFFLARRSSTEAVASRQDFFLFRVVKQTIEAYVEKKLDLSSIVQDLQGISTLQARL